METDLIQKAEEWVCDIYSNAGHLIRTGYWVQQIYPKASEALIVAATTHDIERAFPKGRKPPTPEFMGAKWEDKVYGRWHGRRSAKFVSKFLEDNGANKDLIEKVAKLIVYHEEGGWKEADFLKDADSVSFLEINTPLFISWIPNKLSKNDVREKLDYMYRRIGDKIAAELATPFYSKAMADLDKVKD